MLWRSRVNHTILDLTPAVKQRSRNIHCCREASDRLFEETAVFNTDLDGMAGANLDTLAASPAGIADHGPAMAHTNSIYKTYAPGTLTAARTAIIYSQCHPWHTGYAGTDTFRGM